MTYKTPRFWLWLLAVSLGVYYGLSCNVGDNKPEMITYRVETK